MSVSHSDRHDWFDNLPESLKESAVDLSSQRINNQALLLEVALEVLERLRGQRWAVYGGDFYRQARRGSWVPMYVNWYVEREKAEPAEAFIERSIDAASSVIHRRCSASPSDSSQLMERVVLVAAEPRPVRQARSLEEDWDTGP